jgi:hypothetical protein
MTQIIERALPRKKFVRRGCLVCESCRREVPRRARQQRYCSARCRKRGHYAQSVRTGVFSAVPLSDIALGTQLPKKSSQNKALQRANLLSSRRILAPADVLAVEVWGGRSWGPSISSGGVPIETGRLRARALVR